MIYYNKLNRYTIEKHLGSFSELDDCKILCGSWNVEKPQYVQRLKAVAQRYPHYSMHDVTHSETIIKSIEMLLGEERIHQLSPTDTWLLLQCAYTHDIGMAMSANEVIDEFTNNYEKYDRKLSLLRKNNKEIAEAWDYISLILKNNHEKNPFDVTSYLKDLWSEDTLINRRTRNSIINGFSNEEWYERSIRIVGFFAVISEALLRSDHAEHSVRKLSKELDEKTYSGLIQPWFRQLIYKINLSHMQSFKSVMKLPPKVNGLCGDYAHPRFIAILLRLGDLLDLDSNRFNQAQIDSVRDETYGSFIHQVKHSSISEFCITPDKIKVSAKLSTHSVEKWVKSTYPSANNYDYITMYVCLRGLKELREWLAWISDELKNFRINWLEVIPENFPGSCPSFDENSICLMLDEKIVDEETLNLQYEITSKRATEIIEGSGLYENAHLTFVRELLQNSVDATFRQLYRDYRDMEKSPKKIYPWSTIENPEKYRINIDVSYEPEICPDSIEFSIRDRGIGITEEMLKKMKYVGNIFSEELNAENKEMPQCIKPTGNFGIGMQSVFLVTDTFDVHTRTRNGSGTGDSLLRKMRFCSNRIDGSIISFSIESDKKKLEEFGFGTKTTIRIPLSDLPEYIQEYSQSSNKTLDCFAEPINTYIEIVKGFLSKTYSNSLIPIYINNQKIPNSNSSDLILASINEKDELPYNPKSILKVTSEYIDTFTYYDETTGVLIQYTWPNTTNYHKSTNLNVYYKGILVNDFRLKKKVTIPYFDVNVYLYMDNPENYLEISRDRFLSEKLNNIASRIRLTHLNAMESILVNDETTSIIWISKDNIYNEYRQCVKMHISQILKNYSKKIEIKNIVFTSENNIHFDKTDCYSYYFIVSRFLRYLNTKQSGSLSPVDKFIVEHPDDVWYIDTKQLLKKDCQIEHSNETIDWWFLCQDDFTSYPEIAIKEIRCLKIMHDPRIKTIYKIGKRTGEGVKISERDYWYFVISEFQHFLSKCIKTNSDMRLVFPGNGVYETAEVYSLIMEPSNSDAIRFNRYLISPMSVTQLNDFLNQSFESYSDIYRYLSKISNTNYSNIKSMLYYLRNKQSSLLNHVKQYSSKQLYRTPFDKVSEHDIASCYLRWLCDFYCKYKTKLLK